MSVDVLVQAALERKEAFSNMRKYLETIKRASLKLDPKAKVYLIGSVVGDEYNYSSDIDVLVVTDLQPSLINSELWKVGIREPFEIHVHSLEQAEFFARRGRLVKI